MGTNDRREVAVNSEIIPLHDIADDAGDDRFTFALGFAHGACVGD